MVWIGLIVLLALAGGLLATLLEFALGAVLLLVLGFVLVGVLTGCAVTSRTGASGGGRTP